MGRYATGGGEWMSGVTDDARVYNYALSSGQVKRLYNKGLSRHEGGLNIYKSCLDLRNHAGAGASGVYVIDPDGYGGGDPIPVYCDMEVDGGGWTMVASNHVSDTTIPGGTGRNSAGYELDRNGNYVPLGSPDPNSDYIIGAHIDTMPWDEGRITLFGHQSTSPSYTFPDNLGNYADMKWDITGSGSSRRDQSVSASGVTIFRNNNYDSLHSNTNYFYIDGVRHDYIPDSAYDANSNQATVGGVGRSSTSGTGTYMGHGSTEGSYEGAYGPGDTGAKDSSGYVTWVR